jgi:xylulokinase
VYRATMEGITYLMADAMDQIRDSCGEGFKPTSLYVVGGGSKNKLWRQMLADVLGLELLFPLEPESAALGAAFQVGAVVRGMPVAEFIRGQKVELEEVVVKPSEDQKTQQLYKDGMDRYRSYSRKLFEK